MTLNIDRSARFFYYREINQNFEEKEKKSLVCGRNSVYIIKFIIESRQRKNIDVYF